MRIIDSVNNDRLILTVLLSAVAHYIAISAINLPPPPKPPSEISLSFMEPPPKLRLPETKIVSAPDPSNKVESNEQATLKSEFSSIVAKETIKRGDNGGIPGEQSPKSPPPQKIEPKPEPPSASNQNAIAENATSKKLQTKPIQKKPLRLQDENLLAKFAAKPKEQKRSLNESAQPITKEFSRAPGSGAAFFGVEGVPDYLPELPDGDLTLLNTKAFQYAVFVQRVATRVFGEMRQAGWELLRAADIRAISEPSTVEAVIDKSGNIVSIELKTSSGSSRFDGVLREAVRKGVSDRNPPQSAAQADGNIHFIFQSRSWVRPIITSHGAPSEQRWLLLGTGLR